LPGANGLDLLDHKAKPASLAAAAREQEKPQHEPQPEECFVFHGIKSPFPGQHCLRQ
jgi:hypothetical protein